MAKDRLQWAQWIASKGLNVFICKPGEKKPLEGHSWIDRQTTDAEQLATWFAECPGCNYGVHAGADYVVIDVDTKPSRNGVESFKKICKDNGIDDFRKEINTLIVKTPSFGYHLYFRVRHECGNGHKFGRYSGIDVRGASGYVIGPGCQINIAAYKRSGVDYEVLNPDAPIAELPDFLLPYLKKPGRREPKRDVELVELDLPDSTEAAMDWLSRCEPAIEGENGDDHTYETIQNLRDFGLSPEGMLVALNASGWNKRCEPPWDDSELEGKIANAWQYGQNRPGIKSPAYQVERLTRARPAGGYAAKLTDEYVHSLFHPKNYLALAVDNTDRLEWEEKEQARLEWERAEGIPSDYYPAPKIHGDRDEEFFPAYLVAELDQIPDPTWLIRDVLPEKSLVMTYGGTGSLKTFLELDKALWGATGQPWAASSDHDIEGFKVSRQLRTVIIAGEGASGIKRRVAAWAKRNGILTDDLPVLIIPVMPRFRDDGDLNKLIRTIKNRLPNPDYVIVDTAMWAAAGLNLNLPADSQLLLSSFKEVMLKLNCSLNFVHHTGKDKKLGALGAENLKASVDVVDYVELKEKSRGRRKISVANQKMKDGELRDQIHMEAYAETLGTDEDGRPFSSLVLRRCHGSATADDGDEPRLELALEIIAENKGKMILNMSKMAEEMAVRYATEELTDGELAKATESMRNFLRREVTGGLAPYAHKAGKAQNAPWEFEDRT